MSDTLPPPTTPIELPDFVQSKLQVVAMAVANTRSRDQQASADQQAAAAAAAQATASQAAALEAHQTVTAATADLINTIEQWTGSSLAPPHALSELRGAGQQIDNLPPWIAALLASILGRISTRLGGSTPSPGFSQPPR